MCFVFFFLVRRILISTYQLQIHLYNLKKLLVPVNPPTMPGIFSRVSVPPWRRRFLTALLPPLPPSSSSCYTSMRLLVSEEGSLKCLQRITRTTPIPRVKCGLRGRGGRELNRTKVGVSRRFPGARLASRENAATAFLLHLLPLLRRKEFSVGS